jgi:D-alanyl-D-alanine carboxypeptidase
VPEALLKEDNINMKRIILFISAAFFSNLLFCQATTDRLDSLFKTIYTDQYPGAAIAIESDAKIIFKKGYGLANLQTKDKIETTTNLNIGSLTKQFTAYCILQLAGRGKLSLDDKLVKYFPGFNLKTGNVISVRQLLTHSSGIIDHYAFTDTNIIKHATDKDVLTAVENVDSTYFIPGSKYRYSNTAYCLLALIIEKLSGISYNDFVKKNIFEPLGMNHSAVLKIGSLKFHAALGYTVSPNAIDNKKQFEVLDADQSIFFSTEGDGGIYTSIDDYLKWCNAWQNGNKLNKALMQQAQSAHFLIDPVNKLSYGYGWFVSEKNKTKLVYHTGSNGGFRAISFFIPSSKYHIIIFSNRDDIDLEELVIKINIILHVNNESFTKIESLVSFAD